MNLAGFLLALAGPLARQVLVSLGIGLVTFVGLDAAVNGALDAVKNNLGSLSGPMVQIFGMAGVFTAFSIIAGGVTAGVSMIALKRLGAVT